MTVDRQTEALLGLIEADRALKCDTVLADARGEAQALLAVAHTEAQRRMRDAFAEERVHRDERVGAARANLQTRRRLAQQRRAAALLGAGWHGLHEALEARWRDPQKRRAWTAAVVATAQRLLPPGLWRITHAPDWPDDERPDLAAPGITHVEFVEDTSITAGLRIAAGGNVIDSTLEGLLADRAAIGGALLHLLDDRVHECGQ